MDGDCRIEFNVTKTQARIEFETGKGMDRFTYVTQARRSPDKGRGWGHWKVEPGFRTNFRVATQP